MPESGLDCLVCAIFDINSPPVRPQFSYDLKTAPKGHLPLTSALRGTYLIENLLKHPAFGNDDLATKFAVKVWPLWTPFQRFGISGPPAGASQTAQLLKNNCNFVTLVYYLRLDLGELGWDGGEASGVSRESGPLRAVHSARHAWPGGLVNQDSGRLREKYLIIFHGLGEGICCPLISLIRNRSPL